MNPSQSTPGQGQAGLYRLAASDLPALREAAEMLGQAFYLVDLRVRATYPASSRQCSATSVSRSLSAGTWMRCTTA